MYKSSCTSKKFEPSTLLALFHILHLPLLLRLPPPPLRSCPNYSKTSFYFIVFIILFFYSFLSHFK